MLDGGRRDRCRATRARTYTIDMPATSLSSGGGGTDTSGEWTTPYRQMLRIGLDRIGGHQWHREQMCQQDHRNAAAHLSGLGKRHARWWRGGRNLIGALATTSISGPQPRRDRRGDRKRHRHGQRESDPRVGDQCRKASRYGTARDQRHRPDLANSITATLRQC